MKPFFGQKRFRVSEVNRTGEETEEMKGIVYVIVIKFLVIALYALTVLKIVSLSRNVVFENVVRQNFTSAQVDIDLCYPLNLNNESCVLLDGTTGTLTELESESDLGNPLSCYTKGLKSRTTDKIIALFKQKNIHEWTPVIEVSNSAEIFGSVYQLYFDQICIGYKFEGEKLEDLEFEIKSERNQNFDIYLSVSKKLNDTVYNSNKKHLFKRNCWKKENEECLDSKRKFVLSIGHFSIKNLESPFDTNCVDRNESTQTDCYEACVKRTKGNYLMTYNESESYKLDFEPFEDLSKKCEDECSQTDCTITGFYVETLEEEDGSGIVIKFENLTFSYEALRYLTRSKAIWMYLICTSVFFGIDIYGLFLRSTQVYNKAVNKEKNVTKSNIRVIFSLFIFAVCLSLGLLCEKVLFNFGEDREPANRTYFSEAESIRERNVSVSVCFDLCEIKTKNFKGICNNETLFGKTFGELDEVTWGVEDFKKDASLKNVIRYVPIRQEDKQIPVFFRNFKKCFLVYYDNNNTYVHLPMMKKSFIHLTISTKKIAHFYIEDGPGFTFPKINAVPLKKSVLHNVHTIYQKSDCLYYTNYNYTKSENETFMTTRDDFVQSCIIEKYAANQYLPILLNVKIHNGTETYRSCKFKDEDKLDENIRDECEKEYFEKECEQIETYPTGYDLEADMLEIQEKGKTATKFIVVNLTPFLYETRNYTEPLTIGSVLIVINRVLSFYALFACFYVANVFKNIIGTYFYSFASLYNFQFVVRSAYLTAVLLFLGHAFIMTYAIAGSMTKIHNKGNIEKIGLPHFRVCYEIVAKNTIETRKDDEIWESLKSFDTHEDRTGTLKSKLNPESLKVHELIKNIIWFDESEHPNEEIPQKFENDTALYIDNLKCFLIILEKKYKALDPKVPRLEKLVELTIDLRKLIKKRVFVFLNDYKIVNLDSFKAFDAGSTVVHYLTKEFTYQDDYWYLKNMGRWIKTWFVKQDIGYHYWDYLTGLSRTFGDEQRATTTSIFLPSREEWHPYRSRDGLHIKNRQFNSFVHFRAIDGDKNAYKFTDNTKIMSYNYVYYKESNASEPNDEIVKISFKSNLIKGLTLYKSTYCHLELILHLMILMKIWFKFNMIEIPEIAVRIYPIVQFCVFLILYLIVVFILWAFEITFRFIKFMDFKHL